MSVRGENDDLYIKDGQRSYQKCHVANTARKNSLMKKTIGIEAQRKLARSMMGREERQLKEQLRSMKLEQSKAASERERKISKSKKSPEKDSTPKEIPEIIDPYPVTFGGSSVTRQRSMTVVERNRNFERDARRHAVNRGRRVSKEFEDLSLNTATGKLAIPAHLLLQPGSMSRSVSSSEAGSSPGTPRHGLSGSHSSIDSADGNNHWVGSPEAIHSVRRQRKSVQEQEHAKVLRLLTE